MKRIPLTLLLLAPVALTGCQTLKAHNPFHHDEAAYKSAQQVQPLEVPPGMQQPPTADALTIPNAGSATAQPVAASGTQQESAAPPMAEASSTTSAGSSSTSLSLTDTPDSAYHRVGLALSRGDVGQVTAHDDAAHTYEVAVNTVVTEKAKGGFMHRLFHRSHSETVTGNVTVSITPSGGGSMVSAQGNPDAVERIMAVLQQRLQ